MSKVTITVSDIAEGKSVFVTTYAEGTETVHQLTAEDNVIEVELENVIVTGIEEGDAEEVETGDDE